MDVADGRVVGSAGVAAGAAAFHAHRVGRVVEAAARLIGGPRRRGRAAAARSEGGATTSAATTATAKPPLRGRVTRMTAWGSRGPARRIPDRSWLVRPGRRLVAGRGREPDDVDPDPGGATVRAARPARRYRRLPCPLPNPESLACLAGVAPPPASPASTAPSASAGLPTNNCATRSATSPATPAASTPGRPPLQIAEQLALHADAHIFTSLPRSGSRRWRGRRTRRRR